MPKVLIRFYFCLFFTASLSAHSFEGKAENTSGKTLPPKPIENFSLISQDGKPKDFHSYKGHWQLVFFGFTSCGEVCPLTLQFIKNELKQAKFGKEVKLIFISVDPERDTPKRLKSYLTSFSPQFFGFTGKTEGIKQAAAQFGSYFMVDKSKQDPSEKVMHSNFLYVLNPKQEWVRYYHLPLKKGVLSSDLNNLMKPST